MTDTPNAPRTSVDFTLADLNSSHATFAAWLRVELVDAGAAGFGIEGGVRIHRTIPRDSWEALGSPVVLPVTVHNASAGQ